MVDIDGSVPERLSTELITPVHNEAYGNYGEALVLKKPPVKPVHLQKLFK